MKNPIVFLLLMGLIMGISKSFAQSDSAQPRRPNRWHFGAYGGATLVLRSTTVRPALTSSMVPESSSGFAGAPVSFLMGVQLERDVTPWLAISLSVDFARVPFTLENTLYTTTLTSYQNGTGTIQTVDVGHTRTPLVLNQWAMLPGIKLRKLPRLPKFGVEVKAGLAQVESIADGYYSLPDERLHFAMDLGLRWAIWKRLGLKAGYRFYPGMVLRKPPDYDEFDYPHEVPPAITQARFSFFYLAAEL